MAPLDGEHPIGSGKVHGHLATFRQVAGDLGCAAALFSSWAQNAPEMQ